MPTINNMISFGGNNTVHNHSSVAAESLPVDSLAYQLLLAAQVVLEVMRNAKGSSLPGALQRIFTHIDLPHATQGAIQNIAYRTMRQLGLADVLLSNLAHTTLSPDLLHQMLRCTLALMLPIDHEKTLPYTDFTVVNQAVIAAAAHPKMRHKKNLVNAILRRFLRERDALMKVASQKLIAVWNYPVWWIDAVRVAYPANWQSILQVGNQMPPLTLRVNCRKIKITDYLCLLADHQLSAQIVGPDAIRLAQPVSVHLIPGFREGLVSVQDAAAQRAAPLLELQDGMRVLDACAAPGGKTGHILECAKVDLIALDNDPKRLSRIQENLTRLELNATLIKGDAAEQNWWDQRSFDRILVDAPCTASGIVRRHPDIRWLRRPSDIDQLATLSARILDNLWQMLRPGGKLLFVTCSIWPQECEDQAVRLTQRHHARRLTAPGQLLPTTHLDCDYDGLFYAFFQKDL